MSIEEEALAYHPQRPHGKVEVAPTKPCLTQHDLSLAYTPGVAEPCLDIARNPDDVFQYTARGNLVAVISNGTAVLGLGDIGPLAAKPVMEGKARPLQEVRRHRRLRHRSSTTEDPDDVRRRSSQRSSPRFGGINLEDIKAPECFYIEERLKKRRCRSPSSTTTSTAPRSSPARRCSTRWSSRQRRSRTSRSSSAAPAPRRSRAPSFYLSLGVPPREHPASSTRWA